ncbi:MAG: hypothetical protein F4236_09630 [Acidimicrobiia bacterium]|nr:hypothetical protein [bacterium]MXZ30046.1 hypothetical protein [Acidimicrobiia bacterium]MYB23506.1 hypothetical protein [Acidimicrobiia bacterium]MYE68355.1 hypothetical protein [Acidimicrobiia bacterium]MYJ14515.1 hypothetical protein [Acidimicrobiia bacterium]
MSLRVRHLPVAVTVAAAAAAVALGCSDIDRAAEYRELQAQLSEESQTIWEVVPLSPEQVDSVVVQFEGRTVEVRQAGPRRWVTAEDDPVIQSLMFDLERVLFPLLSYRRLSIDGDNPAFGLRDSTLGVAARTPAGDSWRVMFGAETFSGGGHYARLDGDPHVYTVIPKVIDSLKSVALGERVDRGIDPRFAAALNELQLVTVEEEDLNPWLAQVLDHEGP